MKTLGIAYHDIDANEAVLTAWSDSGLLACLAGDLLQWVEVDLPI